MPTSIFFNGRSISSPGSYSEVDASGLEQLGLGASGIVAMLGEAEGGIPVTALEKLDDITRFTRPEQVRKTYRSGPLRELGGILFEPSRDEQIQAGAQEVVSLKTNPSTQATATLANGEGDALVVTSLDYGAFTSQLNIAIADGTTKGKLLTITFEDVTEGADDIGGDDIFTLQYSGGTFGYTTIVGGVQAGGVIRARATKTADGGDGFITTQLASPGEVEVVSSNAGDTTQVVTVYGTDATGLLAVKETFLLTGTDEVLGAITFTEVLGISISEEALGTVTVRPSGGGATIFDMPAASLEEAAIQLDYGFVNNDVVNLVSDGASTNRVLVFGKNPAGSAVGEIITLTGTTPLDGDVDFSRVERIVVGELEAAQTATMTVTAAQTTPSVQTTITKAADFFNAKSEIIAGPSTRGFIFTVETTQLTMPVTELDVSVSDVDIKDPVDGNFTADLFALINWINQNSQYLSAEAATGATDGAPDNTASPVFLAGGEEGTATFTEYQEALNWLKRIRVNTIVTSSGDPAVHAAIEAHCAYMGGVGRSERDACVGALNGALTNVPSKVEFKTQVSDLNSRHMRVLGQAVERFNSFGERTEFLPPYTAAVAAGMQAGSAVGTSLTFKYANVLSFRQSLGVNGWNPSDDAEEMIQAGCMFLENVDGVGRRWVRNVTSHLSSDNLAFTEASVNEAVNFAVFNFRTNMEAAVGQPGFSGTLNASKGIALGTLGLLVDETILVAYRSLTLDLTADVLEVSVEMAPVIPINFVKNTVHLVTVQQSA